MKKRPMFFVLLLSFLFISCENLLSPKDSYNHGDGKTYTITGDINIEGALPNELFNENSANSVARTGFPTVPNFSDSDLNLSVSATNADSSYTIEGTINAEKTQYSINLPKGQWTITVSGKKSNVVILEGSVTVVLNDEYPVTNSEIIILKPKTTGGKGNLSLKLALDNESIICGGIKATLSISEEPKTKYFLFTDSEGNPASEIDLIFNDIPSGTYSFKLEFYERMNHDVSTGNYECENIIYILNDTVNIFDGLTTNEWSGTGYSEDTFTLTQEVITSFAMTTFYVDAYYGNDDNEGTFFAPKMSINKVLEKIDTINDGTSEYRIYIKGNINNTSENSSFENDSFINITPTKTLNLLICGFGNEKSTINAERDSSQTGRVMYIGENANVTLQNLILTGGYTSEKNGGGIVCEGNLTLDNCEVSKNSAMNGGGVYIESGDFTITGGKISENTSIEGEGGGVYVKDGTFTIENDTLISKNTSCGNGGGVFAEGGIITINGGSISENIFSNDGYGGGGIYLTGTAQLTMTGGKISNNYPKEYNLSNNTFGGGVYVSGGTFSMAGGEISNNYGFYGGGVATEGSFFMSGGTISGNIVTNNSDDSKGNGSAVAVLTGGLFTVSESITINGDVYLLNNQTITVSNDFEGGEVMITPYMYESSGSRRPSGLRKTNYCANSLAHRTTWLRSDLFIY